MTTFICLLALITGLGVAIGRALVVDEAKGQLRKALHRSLERTIESLPPALQDEWADEWRAEFESTRDTPLSAIRFVRGLRSTISELVAETINGEQSPQAAGQRRRSRPMTERASRLWRRCQDYRAYRIARARSRSDAALRDLVQATETGVTARLGLHLRAFVRFAQFDMPYVTRSIGQDILGLVRSFPTGVRGGRTVLVNGGREMTLAAAELGRAWPRLTVELAGSVRQAATEAARTIESMGSALRQIAEGARNLNGGGAVWLALAVVAIVLVLILPA